MQRPFKTARERFPRLAAAALLTLSVLVVLPAPSSAVPSEDDLAAAQDRKAQLNEQFSLLVEEYNEAQVELQQIQSGLADAREDEAEASAQASAAMEQLDARVTGAYMDAGSELEVLLSSGDFSDFSDRLEFLDQLQQQDADLAATAENATQRAQWAQDELEAAEERQQELRDQLSSKKAEIEDALRQQESLIGELQRKVAAEEAAARQAAQEAAAAAAAPEPSTGGSTPTSTGGNPSGSGGAAAAIAAAKSVIGTQYNWGGASPSSGFDCSGLTMWSWAHGGVSLPHSSSAQYAATPRVDRGSLQPGDLLFFYSPISHVSMYLGGNSMIDASHPGPGGQVKIQGVYWGSFVGAGRP